MRYCLMNHQLHNLFPVPVLQGRIEPPLGLVEELTSMYKDCNRGVWASETGVSTGELGMALHQQSPLLEELIKSMMPSVIEYWDQYLGYAPAEIQPTASWSNLHARGDHTGEHSHCNGRLGCHIASVYYLEKGEGGDIELVDPLDYIRRLTPLQKDHGDAIMATPVETRTGDFLLFPGWLRHRTQPATWKRHAISINFNGNLV